MKKDHENKNDERDGGIFRGKMQNVDAKESGQYSDDVHFENEDENVHSSAALGKLRDKLRACESEKKEYLDGWQRSRADFANARKEEEIRRGELLKYASESLVEDILPVLDSFRMAFANKEIWDKVDENWRKGVEYIHSQLFSVLQSRGLSETGLAGERFDPRIHIAIESSPSNDPLKPDIVSEVVQKGYRLNGKIIRLAKVKTADAAGKDGKETSFA